MIIESIMITERTMKIVLMNFLAFLPKRNM